MKVGSLVQCATTDLSIITEIVSWMPGFKKEDIYTVSDMKEGFDRLGRKGIGLHFEEIRPIDPTDYVNAKLFVELQGPNEVNVQEIVDNAMLQTA